MHWVVPMVERMDNSMVVSKEQHLAALMGYMTAARKADYWV